MKRLLMTIFVGLLLFTSTAALVESPVEKASTVYLRIGGTDYSSTNCNNDLSGNGWSWSAQDKTLTINNYSGPEVYVRYTDAKATIAGDNHVSGSVTLSKCKEVQWGTTAKLTVTVGLSLPSLNIAGTTEITAPALSVSSISIQGSSRIVVDNVTCYGSFIMKSGVVDVGVINANDVNISGGNIQFKTLNSNTWIKISGGILRSKESTNENDDIGIMATGSITITGGNIQIKSCIIGIESYESRISISGKHDILIEAYQDALSGTPVVVGGKKLKEGIEGIHIVNGKIKQTYSVAPFIEIDDVSIYERDLKTNQSGNGWEWNAKTGTLKLNGYTGEEIYFKRSGSVEIAGVNNLSFSIQAVNSLKLKGNGTINTQEIDALNSSMSISGKLTIKADVCAHGNLSVSGAKITEYNEGMCSENGSITLKYTEYTGSVRTEGRNGSISMINSAFSGYVETNNKLTFTDTVGMISEGWCRRGGLRISNSALFLRNQDEDEYEYVESKTFSLMRSATMKRSFTLPVGYEYYIPPKKVLTIKSGCTLTVLGDLVVDGKIKGSVVRSSDAKAFRFYPRMRKIKPNVAGLQKLTCQ